LRQASDRLTSEYQGSKTRSSFETEVSRVAYLLTRFPATYAACYTAMSYAAEVMPRFTPESMLDLGSGPGTAIAAAQQVFPSIHKVCAIETNNEISAFAESLLDVNIEREKRELSNAQFGNADLVTISYVLGELGEPQRRDVLDRAWQAAQQMLVVVEPGTPEGYGRILRVRETLLAAGAQVVAPCPHNEKCPMTGTKDWCHFAARVERTSIHRQLKRGSLGHEDEKFSYVAFAREPAALPRSRIVRHPMQSSGRVRLQLCVGDKGLRDEVVPRSRKGEYRLSRRARWGDAWPPILTMDER
jgi:ribosomal protein RSM22 (predicted rRNA methylase)